MDTRLSEHVFVDTCIAQWGKNINLRETGEMSYNAKEKRHKRWQKKNNEMPGQKTEHASGYVNVFSFHVSLLGGSRAWAALPHSLAEKV